jgi:spermidine synthase
MILVAAGAAIILTQYVAVREIGSTFFSTELTLLGAVVVSLVGPSLGYAVSHRLSPRLLAVWGTLSVAAHLALPFGLRALVGALAARGLETWAMGLVAMGGCLLLTGFYAVFLPRLTPEGTSLSRTYALELGGALAALALLLVSPSWRVTLCAFFAIAVLVVHLGVRRLALTGAVGAAAVAAAVFYPRLDGWAARVYYDGYHGLGEPRIVETVYSPYQRIDVVDAGGDRSLFLDGVPFFRSGDLDAFNVILAELPGSLRGPRGRALVIGSGSFSSASRLEKMGYAVTVVELDAAVADVGFRRFGLVHGLAPGEVKLVVEDGRRFLARARERWDFIALDVPAPYHVATALLHTPSFYRLVRSRLAPGGVVSISLCDDLEGDVGRHIAASALQVFREVAVAESDDVGLAILYGAEDLPFDAEDVRRQLETRGGGLVWSDAAVRERLRGTGPLDERRLASVLVMARDALPGRGEGAEREGRE